MVHSPNPSALSHAEGYVNDDIEDYDDSFEDDADTDASFGDEELPEAVSSTWFEMTRDTNCMIVYCFSGSDVVRVCGSKGVCHRCIPTSHKDTLETPTSHAPEGWFLSLPPTRRGSTVLDGLASSYRSDEDHQAAMQRRTDENQVMARRLAEASPDNGRSFRQEGDDASEDDDDDVVDETPARTTRASRFAHPPASTHGRVPGARAGSLAGSSDRVPRRNGPLLTPTDPAGTLDSLTLLIKESLSGQAALQAQAVASQLVMDNLLAQLAFRDQVSQAMSAPPSLAPVVTTVEDDSDAPPVEGLGPKARSRNGSKHVGKKKRGKKGRRDKAPSTWYGVVAGQHGSLRATLSSAKAYAKSYDPRGRISSKFDTKAEAEAWVALNIDDPDSSDTASVGADSHDSGSDTDTEVQPRARRGGLIPPGRLPTSTEPLFDLVSQDPSVGKKNELFGIVIRKELEVLKALAPKYTDEDTQRSLAECIVDGTMLPGTSSESFGIEEEGGDGARFTETLSRVFRDVKASSIGGVRQTVDDGFQNKSRVSLRGVKNLEQLHTLEQELGQAIPREIANMKLAFGAALHPLCWTDAQEDTYLLGGHYPYISIMIMRYYSDLVRELARRSVHGWARVKVDIDYFVKQLLALRTNVTTRFLVMVKTYIFLRDQQHESFNTIDRVNSQMNALYARLEASSSAPAEADGTSVSMCQNCKQKGLHKGGRKQCPFRDLEAGSARSAGTLAAKLCREGSTKTEAYQKAKLAFEEDD
jgi:hypothetical protein